MTRKKKTRSAGTNGQRHLSAEDIRKTRQPKEETKKKGAGLKSGSRNSMVAKTTEAKRESAPKDKRLGSKKPIALLPQAEAPQSAVIPVVAPKASLSKAKPQALSPELELAQIENDSQLQALLERVERDEILTGKDAKYFNAKIARMEQLMAELGLSDDDAEADPLAVFESKDWRKDILGDED